MCLSDRKTFTKNSRYCATVLWTRFSSVTELAFNRRSQSQVKSLLLMLPRNPAKATEKPSKPGTLVAGVGAAGYRYQIPARRDLC